MRGLEDDVIGKWKLVKGNIYSSIKREGRTEDYSCDQVVYEFGSDGQLKINSEIEDAMVLGSGEYPYEIVKSEVDAKESFSVLRIEGKSYTMMQSSTEMTVKMNPINPLAFYETELTAYFVRIN